MATIITCPSCSSQFEAEEILETAIRERFKAEYNQKWTTQRKEFEAQLKKEKDALEAEQKKLASMRDNQEEETQKRVAIQLAEKEKSLQTELEQKLSNAYESKLKFLEKAKEEGDEQLKEARKKELEFLKKEEELIKKGEELELEKQRSLREERARLSEEVKKQAEEKEKERQEQWQLERREWEVKFDQQKKLLEEAQRKAAQGSMQLQGEAQELELEDMLRAAFPFDLIKEVGKGIRGADCMLTVRNGLGQECGCIIFESKRTQSFGGDWIDKLKTDMSSCKADIAVIVSQALPKDMDRFGEKQGVYVCSFAEVISLVGVLRQAILKLHEARKSQENKGDKMVMLYDYLTGSEFMGQWNTMRESFNLFRAQLQKERDDFERNWKKKEKLLQSIVNNSLQISGSIEGISGMDHLEWTALPEQPNLMIE